MLRSSLRRPSQRFTGPIDRVVQRRADESVGLIVIELLPDLPDVPAKGRVPQYAQGIAAYGRRSRAAAAASQARAVENDSGRVAELIRIARIREHRNLLDDTFAKCARASVSYHQIRTVQKPELGQEAERAHVR